MSPPGAFWVVKLTLVLACFAPLNTLTEIPQPLDDTNVHSLEQEASFKWSPDGRAVLCLTSTDVDATGKVGFEQ